MRRTTRMLAVSVVSVFGLIAAVVPTTAGAVTARLTTPGGTVQVPVDAGCAIEQFLPANAPLSVEIRLPSGQVYICYPIGPPPG